MSYKFDDEESNELGSESGSIGTFCNGLRGLLPGLVFSLVVAHSADWS